MTASKRLILENSLGQKVRAFEVEAREVSLIYRHDIRRVELHADLSSFDDAEITYDVLKTFSPAVVSRTGFAVAGGRLRLAQENESLDKAQHELSAEQDDDRKMALYLKKSSVGHAAAVALLIISALVAGYFADKKEEPTLVTIQMPPSPPEKQVREHVKVSETKIKPTPVKAKKVVQREVKPKPHVVERKHVVQKLPNKRQAPQVVRNAPARDVGRVGALAALGGIKNGARNAEGLDANSLKNIRSAGSGSGGGGIGDVGRGGIRGMMPGQGLIAGSAGGGGRAESAGGYGTKGAGGGKAGYGKISLVGGTSGVTLPLEDEAVVQGGLDRDQIAAVINRNKGQIIYCYEQGLQGQPDLRGRVSIDFTIGASGRVTIARVGQSSLGSKSVEGCMIAKMRTWQFPRPVGNVNVDVMYPFELRRVSSR